MAKFKGYKFTKNELEIIRKALKNYEKSANPEKVDILEIQDLREFLHKDNEPETIYL